MLLFTVCLLLSALALMALPGLAVGAEPKAPLANYPTAQETQQHCPYDLVVCVFAATRPIRRGHGRREVRSERVAGWRMRAMGRKAVISPYFGKPELGEGLCGARFYGFSALPPPYS
jgi:hypothetical protein